MPLLELASTASGGAVQSRSANSACFASTRSGPFSCTCSAVPTASARLSAGRIRLATSRGGSLSNPASSSSGNRSPMKPNAVSTCCGNGSQSATSKPARANTIDQARPIRLAPTTATCVILPSPRALEVSPAGTQSQRVAFDPDWLSTIAGRLELLTPSEMARADAASPGLGIPGSVLMQNAGRAVARAIQRRFRPCRTLVLAGPGNNGGDGYVAARLLQQGGWPVAVAALAPPRSGSDAVGAAEGWHVSAAPFAPAAAARADLVIDAVFGAGLARDVDKVVADTLRAAQRVVAVDVPSGVDGETGAMRGFAPQAAMTVTFFRLKPGHLLLPGRGLCGETLLADIGLPAAVLSQVQPR